LLLDLAPGHQVLDACAGRGGKTTLLASLGLGGITLDAADRHPGKLGQLQKEAKRLNLPTIRTVPVDLLVGTGDLAPSYDRILLDAPCSGTGTLARRPEIRWRLQPDDITRLAQTQWRLLQRCLDLLRPGGVLLYCSCSLLPDEGTGHLDRLLAESPPGQYAVTRRLQLVPHRHGTDGFFAARVARLR
jgi:16S rRNA (cytosine967-C5)-methyltransferase